MSAASDDTGGSSGDAAPAEVVVGVDVGTTATKVTAFGVDASWRRSASVEYPLLSPSPGWEVQDPDVIEHAVLDSLARVAAATGDARVVAVALSTAMHGLIGLDADDRPVTPLLTWADSRAADEARRLRDTGVAAALHRASGTPVHPFSPLTKLMWFGRHEPELAARVRRWIDLKAWVVRALTGTVATELSCASGSGLLDSAGRTWNPVALELAGIGEDRLPPILDTTESLPLAADVAGRVGLPAGTPVVVGAGDGPLGNLGTGALSPGVVGLSLGTSGAVRMAVDGLVADPGEHLFCYALTRETWVVGGAVSNGGVVVRWAGDVFGADLAGDPDADARLLALAAAVPPGSEGLVMVPYLLAERAPLWDPDLRGAYLGVRRDHTRGHFVRAAVEGVALQLSAILTEMDALGPTSSVRATGGVFRSTLWRDVLAAVLDRPLTVTGGADGSGLGAAALALYGLGRADTLLGALDLLPTEGDLETVRASAADVDVYRGVRSGVGELLREVERAARVVRRG